MIFSKQKLLIIVTFLSAYLIFSIQPMVAQKLTPLLGGAPAVWNSLLMLFQFLLFAGYFFVGAFIKDQKKLPAYIYVFLIVLSVPMLAVSFTTEAYVPDVNNPNFWVLYKGILLVGLPFFLLATTAPLVQILFYRSRAGKENSPYWLYSVSNFGSFLALITYPVLVQPHLGLENQILVWSLLFSVYAVLALYLFYTLYLKSNTPTRGRANITVSSPTVSYGTKGLWLLLAFCPASLIHGVTTIITNDISSFPLLWVIPLCLYLATYILAFSGKMNFLNGKRMRLLAVLFMLPLCIIPLWFNPIENIFFLIAHLSAFSVLSLLCHVCLYNNRPHATKLGSFYAWIAAGGVLAGIFNALISPYVFEKIYEYPLTLILSLFSIYLFTSLKDKAFFRYNRNDLIGIMAFVSIATVVMIEYPYDSYDLQKKQILAAILSLSILVFAFLRINRVVYTTLFACMALSGSGIALQSNIYLPDFKYMVTDIERPYISRSFFGISKVVHTPITPDVTEYLYYNGFILHSAERYVHSTNSMLTDTGTYHTPVIDNAKRLNKPVASLGLGSGSDLCLTQGKTKIEFYEISQNVIDIASNPDLLKSLSLCGENYDISLGDARLEILKKPDEYYGGIISTATSSSTVPFHLMTKEAFTIYLSKLAPGGALVFLAPASYFDYTPLFAAYSHEFKMPVYELEMSFGGDYKYQYFLFLKPPENNEVLGENLNWSLLQPSKNKSVLWTDDYYNIWAVIK
ncbi:MAG: hypothetical protein CMH28_09740 [Micavibrio sp.]|nr:hypothetical protein [Micavibrio sp.]